ncbi:glycosyl hydrolase [Pedobacter sp. BMA]|uniref:glycosyl hydrolase n=1 Tax=Pedobacter sp. BMA TaxID=1663685 RepID=UPI00069D99BA|nr:glycosyl hydrolase [Pedobacter sp. BMA]
MTDFKYFRVFIFALLMSFILSDSVFAQQNENAKPWVFWYWVKGAASKTGITADLEAMKANGIGGAYLMTIQGPDKTPFYNPPAVQLSSEWWKLVEFAMIEAKRLDLKLGMHVSDGFALAGGPWITPDLSMQKVVWTKTNITNGASAIKLAQPETKENYYQDIAVYAFPSPTGQGISTRTVIPKITASNGADAGGLIQPGNKKNFGAAEPCYIQYEFEKPFTCRTITIKVSGNNYQAQRLAMETSDDGINFHPAGRLEAPRHGWQDTDEDVTHSISPLTARFFRFIYDKKGSEPGAEDLDAAKWKPSLKLINLELSSEASINQFEGKNGSVWRISKRSTGEQIAKNLCVPLNKIINLSGKLKPDGTLNWKAPKGNWTILRIGHTSTGHTNATAGGGMGLECDKFNPEAVKLQFDNWYGEALKHGGPEIAKKVLSVFHVDSWECGSQNWSPLFKTEFLKRRGYDLTPYLPVMTGLPVESAQVSEDFLYDVRKTIAELVVDQFYKTLAILAKQKGVTFTAESIAPTMMSDGLLHYKTVDVPMGEFWLNSPTHDKPNDMLDAISGGHIYGKNIIQAEAFTTVRMDWNESPANMKTLQDRNYALGVNRMVYHVFVQNPDTSLKPGVTLDGVGLYFQRDQTWWMMGKAWVDYAERTQELLQQGKPVVDIAVFTGDDFPRRSVLPDRLVETLPGIFGNEVVEKEKKRLANVGEPLRQIPAGVTHSANMADPQNWVNPLRGYAYDSFNPDVLASATVKNGNVVFESGASYKILVIPGAMKMNPDNRYMSYEILKKLSELIKSGAKVIVSDKPLYENGIRQERHTEFDQLATEIWDGNFESYKSNGHPLYQKKLGAGRVFQAPFYGETFDAIGLERDVDVQDKGDVKQGDVYSKAVGYSHRMDGDKNIYFITNQEDKKRSLQFHFRNAGKSAQIYDPVNNTLSAPLEVNGGVSGTNVDLTLYPNQSVFVILDTPVVRSQNTGQQFNIAKENNFKPIQDISTSWEVKFDPAYGGPSKPVPFKELTDWTKHPDSTIKFYSGTATYTRNFTYSGNTKNTWVDLGDFSSMANVKINGVSCGTLWTSPYRLDISKAIKKGKNIITVEVVNTWANRLIGDSKLPENKRITKTTAPFRLEGKPLNPAGLLGPVVILLEEK